MTLILREIRASTEPGAHHDAADRHSPRRDMLSRIGEAIPEPQGCNCKWCTNHAASCVPIRHAAGSGGDEPGARCRYVCDRRNAGKTLANTTVASLA
ncbi:hypothetical protein GCM10009761_24200 [Agromyces terreus]